MILTIAKIIVIWTLASIPAALIVSRLIGANERAGSGKPDEFRRERELLALADSECADWVDPLIHGEPSK